MCRHCRGVLPRRTGGRQEGGSRGASLRPAAVWAPQAPVPILRGQLGPDTMRPLTCAGSRSHGWPEQMQRAAPAFLGLVSHSAGLYTCLGTRPPRPAVPHLRMDRGRTGQARQGCGALRAGPLLPGGQSGTWAWRGAVLAAQVLMTPGQGTPCDCPTPPEPSYWGAASTSPGPMGVSC